MRGVLTNREGCQLTEMKVGSERSVELIDMKVDYERSVELIVVKEHCSNIAQESSSTRGGRRL